MVTGEQALKILNIAIEASGAFESNGHQGIDEDSIPKIDNTESGWSIQWCEYELFPTTSGLYEVHWYNPFCDGKREHIVSEVGLGLAIQKMVLHQVEFAVAEHIEKAMMEENLI